MIGVFLIYFAQISADSSSIPKISQSSRFMVRSNGFHGNLYFDLNVESFVRLKHCSFVVKINIPSGAYVELESTKTFKNQQNELCFMATSYFDPDGFAEKSKPKIMYVYSGRKMLNMFEFGFNVEIPIRFKYHVSANKIENKTIEFQAPSVLVSCKNDENVFLDFPSLRSLSAPCHCYGKLDVRRSSEICKYFVLKEINWHKNVAIVPVGKKSHAYVSVMFTLLIVWFSVIYIVVLTLFTSNK